MEWTPTWHLTRVPIACGSILLWSIVEFVLQPQCLEGHEVSDSCLTLSSDVQAYDEIESLPTWAARLERALQLVQMPEEPASRLAERRSVLAAGLDLVYIRLRALADYKTDFQLHQTVITLIRPSGAEADNYCGLDKVRTLVLSERPQCIRLRPLP